MAEMLVAAQSNSWRGVSIVLLLIVMVTVLAISRFTAPRLKMSLGREFE